MINKGHNIQKCCIITKNKTKTEKTMNFKIKKIKKFEYGLKSNQIHTNIHMYSAIHFEQVTKYRS